MHLSRASRRDDRRFGHTVVSSKSTLLRTENRKNFRLVRMGEGVQVKTGQISTKDNDRDWKRDSRLRYNGSHISSDFTLNGIRGETGRWEWFPNRSKKVFGDLLNF